MIHAFARPLKLITKVSAAIFLTVCLLFVPLSSAFAARTSMSGDYVADTVQVAQSLQKTIAIEKDDENRSEAEDEAVKLITDYISRYRNRPQVNGTTSFTTMQTALNALAGHYKTFSSRPVPEKLKERLNKELSRAEKIVAKEI